MLNTKPSWKADGEVLNLRKGFKQKMLEMKQKMLHWRKS